MAFASTDFQNSAINCNSLLPQWKFYHPESLYGVVCFFVHFMFAVYSFATWTHYIMFLNFHQQQLWFNHQEPVPGAAPADHQRVRGGHDQPHRPRQEVELQCRHDQDVGQEGGADPSQTVQEIYLSGFRQRARQGHGVWPPVSSYPQENIARSIQICSYLMVTIFGCWSHRS